MRVVAIIPSRYGSTRLPAKPLQDICGKPLVQHVYEKACQTSIETVIVATDDQRIVDAVKAFDGRVELTSPDCASGTDRLQELADHFPADIYVNIQGDEPLLIPEAIDRMVAALKTRLEEGASTPVAATLCFEMSAVDAANPNIVKVVCDTQGNALYFSRSRIPFDRDGEGKTTYLGHVGIYAYSATALHQFGKVPPSPLEQVEKLEQLRLLQAGIPILCVHTKRFGPSVDTQEDLDAVRRIVSGKEESVQKRDISSLLPHIRVIITDVDGVLTDGSLLYGAEGENNKTFNVRDGLGMVLARESGIQIAVLSGRDCPALRARLKDLDITAFRLGKLDKISVLHDLCHELDVTAQDCIFVGDDLPDVPCFEACALGVTVADALPEVKASADIVLKASGGHGALREIIDMLRRAR